MPAFVASALPDFEPQLLIRDHVLRVLLPGVGALLVAPGPADCERNEPRDDQPDIAPAEGLSADPEQDQARQDAHQPAEHHTSRHRRRGPHGPDTNRAV